MATSRSALPSRVNKIFRSSRNDPDTPSNGHVNGDYHPRDEKDAAISISGSSTSSEESIQGGVKQAEAVTKVWTTQSLSLAYVGIFVVFYVLSLLSQINSNLSVYVTSSFSQQALVSTTSVVSSVVSGVAKLPTAKIIDIWGRAEGYLLMVFLLTIGLIIMAACNTVQAYAAGQVFFYVGYVGIQYVLDVFIADTSSLKNRPWLFAFSTCPFIANSFAGPAAAEAFYTGSTWRWGFGSFTIIVPVVCAPVVAIFIYNRNKAKKQGVLQEKQHTRSPLASLGHYTVEFDVLGMLLLIAAFSLVLLPLSLAKTATGGWGNASMIAMIVLGFVFFFVFAAWERFGARVTFLPWHLLRDPQVLGACLLGATLFISFYCWDTYFTSYLQAVHNLSIKDAGYVYNTYNIGSCFFSLIVGVVIRLTGSYKYTALAAIPIQILGTGLMIHFRDPGHAIGYVVMCQILIAFSGGALVVCEEIAIMAAATHQEIAVVLALLSLFTSVGGAVGQAISGAIWTNKMLPYLDKYLAPTDKGLASSIYASLSTQVTYPVGTPVRDAIVHAYGDVQRLLTITGTAVLPAGIVFILLWRNIDVRTVKQTKGNLV